MVKETNKKTRGSGAKSAFGKRLSEELVIGSMFAELLGTFALASFVLILCTLSNGASPILIAFGIAGLYFIFARLSGAHLNPAVTLALAALQKVSLLRAAGYILAQVVGGIGAIVVVKYFVDAYPSNELTGQTMAMFKIAVLDADHWRPFAAEVLGASIIGFAIGALAHSRKSEVESAFTIGMAFLIALTVASIGSAAILNPAVAISLSAYYADNLWTVLQYALGPVVGVVAGALAYKFLKWDIVGDKNALND